MTDNTPSYSELQDRIKALEETIEVMGQESRSLEFSNHDLLEQLPHEVHIWELVRDEEGKIKTWKLKYANTAALSSWNEKAENVIGKTTNEIFSDDNATDLFMPVVEKIFAEGKAAQWEELFPATNQTLQMVSIPMGDHLMSTGLDVSEQRNMEAELQLFRKMEAIGKLASGIAHDFNNQLTPIMGYADVLEESLTEPNQLNAIEHIKTSVQRCASLTSHLLTFTKSTHATLENLEIDPFIEETIELLNHSIEKNVHIEHQLNAANRRVDADPSLLQSVLINLAFNGQNAMPDGGNLSFETEFTSIDENTSKNLSATFKAGEYIIIKVRDTGTGMSDQIKAQIFDPFFTTREAGHGLGLASAYSIIQQHKGLITVNSAIGVGSTFTIYMPIATNKTVETAEPLEFTMRDLKPMRILVVDDEQKICQLYCDLLTPHGHKVTSENDPLLALDYYAREWQNIDLVILDMNMPNKSGLEAFKAMQQVNPGVRAVICTGYSASASIAEILSAGVFSVLYKPFGKHGLFRILGQIQERSRQSEGSAFQSGQTDTL